MKLIYLKSALKCNSFDVTIGIKIPFFRVLVTIEPGRSLLQFVTTDCLKGLSLMGLMKVVEYERSSAYSSHNLFLFFHRLQKMLRFF